MPSFEPACLTTALGSVPLADPQVACEFFLKYYPQLPPWPQLPRRSFHENMYAQYSEGLPGVVLDGSGDVSTGSIHVDRDNVEAGLERIYEAYVSGDNATLGSTGEDYAAGLHAMLGMKDRLSGALAVKGHVTGPISLGLQVTDLGRRPILYEEVLADAIARLLRMKAAWQEEQLRRLAPETIIFLDEPYLSTFGSAYVPVSRDQVIAGVEEVLGGIQGLKGIHCCGNTDWSMLLATSMDIISFDAYHYGVPFSLYAGEVKDFLRRGGIIAWGIVPNEAPLIAQETAESLEAKLLDAVDLLAQKGVSRDDLLHRGLVTASCGLGTLTPEDAVRASELVNAVSERLRKRIGAA